MTLFHCAIWDDTGFWINYVNAADHFQAAQHFASYYIPHLTVSNFDAVIDVFEVPVSHPDEGVVVDQFAEIPDIDMRQFKWHEIVASLVPNDPVDEMRPPDAP